MYRVILLFTLISPLIGIAFMEMGAYGIDVAGYGRANGATMAYLAYLVAFVIAYKYRTKATITWASAPLLFIRADRSENFSSKYIRTQFRTSIYVLSIFLFMILFVFGGINVWRGEVGKGEFRGSFGAFGALAYYITKLFAPAIVAYLAGYYAIYRKKVPGLLRPFLINIILVFLIGASWGYKSTAVVLLVPAAIIMWQNISLKKLVVIGVLVVSIFVSFAVLFDEKKFESSEITETFTNFSIAKTFDIRNMNAFNAVIYRLTVVQGNTPWKIWDLYSSGADLPNYWKTLPAIFGDNVLAMAGVDKTDRYEFTDYHYAFAMTNMAKSLNYDLTFEYNVTATAFSDGILIGGWIGVILVGLFAGYLTRKVKNKMIYYFGKGDFIKLSLCLVFFVSYFRAWLNSGGIYNILHISLFVGLGLTYLMLRGISKVK